MEDDGVGKVQFRLFTLEEANEALPELSRLISQVNRRRQDLIYLLVELEGLHSQHNQHRHDAELGRKVQTKKAEVDALRKELAGLNNTVRETGVVVRDYERGLVDFPAIVAGQPGYLCWLVGEEAIGFWHGPEDGFAGRRPLKKAST
jgi:hypothetical protein